MNRATPLLSLSPRPDARWRQGRMLAGANAGLERLGNPPPFAPPSRVYLDRFHRIHHRKPTLPPSTASNPPSRAYFDPLPTPSHRIHPREPTSPPSTALRSHQQKQRHLKALFAMLFAFLVLEDGYRTRPRAHFSSFPKASLRSQQQAKPSTPILLHLHRLSLLHYHGHSSKLHHWRQSSRSHQSIGGGSLRLYQGPQSHQQVTLDRSATKRLQILP